MNPNTTQYARLALAGTLLATSLSIPAAAQDVSLEPSFDTVTLSSGFVPDPYTVSVQSGGSIDASSLNDSCSGYIADAPDVRLNYTAGGLPLIVSVEADDDTTLVVNTPNGSWYCDDDTGEGVNPLMRFENPQSGQYDIWIGTFWDEEYRPATLEFSELDTTIGESDSSGGSVDFSQAPNYGTISLSSGFTPDPYLIELRSGGSVSASGVSSGCSGYVASAPDVRLNYSGGSLPLILSVDASADTTLVVNDPNGNWYCDDDSGDGVNPSLRFEEPLSGQYDIWVGTYSDGSFQDATLSVSELYSE